MVRGNAQPRRARLPTSEGAIRGPTPRGREPQAPGRVLRPPDAPDRLAPREPGPVRGGRLPDLDREGGRRLPGDDPGRLPGGEDLPGRKRRLPPYPPVRARGAPARGERGELPAHDLRLDPS